MALRDYQTAVLEDARAAMRRGARRVLIQLPTGGGKTVISAEMLGNAARNGLSSQFLVHRRELIEQTSETFRAFDIEHGVVGAGFPFAPDRRIQISGVHSLVNCLEQVAMPDMVVLDEAHHGVAGTWRAILDRWSKAWLVGLTATPERLDGRGLDDLFDVIVPGPSIAMLIARGFLSPYTYFAPGKPDLAGLRTNCGDFNRADVGSLMDKPKLIGDVVQHYLRLAAGQRGIVFAASVDHSRHIAEAFCAAGVRAAHLDGSMKERERREIVAAFRAGRIDIMTNVDLFGEGFDVPGIVYVGLCRPTKSLTLFMQQVGRALRPIYAPGMPLDNDEQRLHAIAAGPKPAAIIADHAGNAFTHGLPDDERSWSLEGRRKRDAAPKVMDGFSIRQCLECYRVSPSRTIVCPGCGHEFEVRSREPDQEAGELFQLDRATAKARVAADKAAAQKLRKEEERACKSLADFIALGKARDYNNPSGWAYHQWELRNRWKKKGRAA